MRRRRSSFRRVSRRVFGRRGGMRRRRGSAGRRRGPDRIGIRF